MVRFGDFLNIKLILLKRFFLIWICCFGFFFSDLHATTFSILYGVSLGNASVTDGDTSFLIRRTSPQWGGGGLLLGHSLFRTLGIEYGALYLGRGFQTESSSVQDFQYKSLQLPLLLKFWIARPIALGLGGYAASLFSPPFQTSLLSSFDFGYIASLNFIFDIVPGFAFTLDLRWIYGNTKSPLSSTPISISSRDYQGLMGIRIGI